MFRAVTEAEGRGCDPVKPVLSPPPSILLRTVPRRYFCCGSLLLLVLAGPYLYFGSPIMLATYFCKFMVAVNDHVSGKELLIRFIARAFRELLSIYVFSYFPFGFEGRMWDLIVSVPDHCLSFYFECLSLTAYNNKRNITFKMYGGLTSG